VATADVKTGRNTFELGLAMLIAESEEVHYEPVAVRW
jgi:hypothetical protein